MTHRRAQTPTPTPGPWGRRAPRRLLVLAGIALSATLVAEVAVPPIEAHAEVDSGASEPAVLGGFALGDGVEGFVEPASGDFSFAVPVAGISVGWGSPASGVDGSGLGGGWSLAGVARVHIDGGVRVSPASGGVYAADASVPSGLAGYPLGDVVFRPGPRELPARADGLREPVAAAFELVELGGVRTWFSAAGDPVVRMDANGNRSDWEWAPGHRLLRAIGVTGVLTELDWSDPARVRVETSAGAARAAGSLELTGGRVSAVEDATGGRVQIGYTATGLVARIVAVSGAATEVSWQRLADGRVAVDRVRVIDEGTGAELSARQWSAQAGLASGWPAHQVPAVAGPTASFADDGHTTTITDGVSTVSSEFDALGRLLGRDVSVTTGSGSFAVQRQAYTYPAVDAAGGVPPQLGQPTGVSVTHLDAAGGQRTRSEAFEFDEFGRLTEQVAEDGTITQTEYDDEVPEEGLPPIGLPVVQRVIAPDGLVAETRHELNPNRTAHVVTETFTGRLGNAALTRTGRREFEVDADGFVRLERVFPQGGAGTPAITEYTKTTDAAAGTVTTRTTVAAGTAAEATSTRVVDALHGGVLAETSPIGSTVTAVYDAAGRPIERTDPAGNVSRYDYDTVHHDGQNATIVTGPDGVVTTTRVDVLGRVTEITDNIQDGEAVAGHVRIAETREYPAPGVVRVTDAWGAASSSTIDLYGRTVRSVGPNGVTELTVYDDVANTVTTALTPTGRLEDAETTSTAHLDSRGQTTRTTGIRADRAPVPETTATFDGLGRTTETTDGTHTTTTGYDPFGNPITTTTTPAGAADAEAPGVHPGSTAAMTATRTFDAFGASTAKTLSNGIEARTGAVMTYDPLGRPESRTDQAGGTSTQTYTTDGLVASTTTSYGQTTRNEYDPDTRALTRTETTSPIGATVVTAYDHDPVTGELLAVFDPADRAGTEIRFEYDAWGNTTRTTYPDGGVIKHEYDEHGRKVGTTDVAGNVTRYRHDQTGLVTTATQTDPSGDLLAEVRYRYDPYGRLLEQARSNGVTTTYAYTSVNRIASETATRADGTTVSERTYEYDARGNVTARTDTRPDPRTGSPETTTTAYEYDSFDRLIRSAVHDGPAADAPARRITRYELTVGGDIHAEHVTDQSGATTTRRFTYGPTGTLTGVTTTHPDGSVTTEAQAYDSAGNLTLALNGTRYTYNAANQPLTETTPDGTTIHTGYWATGQRATRTHGGSTAATVFHWNGGALVNDTHTTGSGTAADGTPADEASVTAGYLLGVGRHARTLGTAASTRFTESDFHGNTTELTDPTGTVITSYEYTDYGIATTHDHAGADHGAGTAVGDAGRNPFQYAGEHTDPTGTQYLQARTYDPVSMRMTSVDPEPQHNRYHYAALNPISLADPTGRLPALPTWANVLLAGVGLVLAGIGVGAAAGAYATATALGALTLTSKAVLGSSIGLAVVDLGATAATAWDEFDDFMSDELAFGLGLASFALGGATVIADSLFRRYVRLDIDALRAIGAPDDAAAIMFLQREERIAEEASAVFAEIGLKFDVPTVLGAVRTRVGAVSNWNYDTHVWKLGELRNGDVLIPSGRPRVIVSDELGHKMRTLASAEYHWEEWAGDLGNNAIGRRIALLRDNLIDDLQKSRLTVKAADGTTALDAFPTGIHQPYDYYNLKGELVYRDTGRLGTDGVWGRRSDRLRKLAPEPMPASLVIPGDET